MPLGGTVHLKKVKAMIHTFASETVPLVRDADGVIRVGKTRVTLDTVVSAFLDGATAEEINYNIPLLTWPMSIR